MTHPLRELRLSIGLKQYEFAPAVGTTPCTLSQIENGHIGTPRKVIDRAAELLGLDPWELRERVADHETARKRIHTERVRFMAPEATAAA